MKTLEQLGNACKQASRQIMNADRNQKDALLRAIAKPVSYTHLSISICSCDGTPKSAAG